MSDQGSGSAAGIESAREKAIDVLSEAFAQDVLTPGGV